jgi:hypothetical protein
MPHLLALYQHCDNALQVSTQQQAPPAQLLHHRLQHQLHQHQLQVVQNMQRDYHTLVQESRHQEKQLKFIQMQIPDLKRHKKEQASTLKSLQASGCFSVGCHMLR